MTTKTEKIVKAANAGCLMAYQAMKVSEQTGVPFYVICAFLEQETGGGKNEFGHDPTIYIGAGLVTKKKYEAYKAARDADLPNGKRHMQGVGPMQLTWYSFQDDADAQGGCWNAEVNLLVGVQLLAEYYSHSHDWWTVAKQYNGSASYADQVSAKIAKWKAATA